MTHRSTLVDAPTQAKHPWRAVVRTIFAFVVGIAAMIPGIVASTGLAELAPWLGAAAAASAAITRVMASPVTNAFLSIYVPWLAAEPRAAV